MLKDKSRTWNGRHIWFLLTLLVLAAGLTAGAAFAGGTASIQPKSLASPLSSGRSQVVVFDKEHPRGVFSPTPTVTGTPPTSTRTRTATATATSLPPPPTC